MFISMDISAGEPTILLNLCDDPTLRGVLFDYRGRRPEWENGLLMSDSLYVTLMSGTDVLGPLLRDMPQEWYDAWVTDNEKAKGWNAEFKKAYKVAKIATLALIYGLSPAGLVRQFAENGLTLSLDDARKIYSQFWASIKYASKLKEKLVKEFEKAYKAKRALISPFMFPLPTGKPKDALNRNVQSSISSFLRFLWRRLFPNHLGVTMVCVVHDELVVECKKELVEDFKKFFYEKLSELNTELNLKYPMAMGFAVGETFYEIH